MTAGNSLQVKTGLYPLKSTNVIPVYRSSRPDIAYIDKTGYITTIKPGKTTITVSYGKLKQSFILTVYL